jgi:predicted transcriptional regulator
MATGRTRSITFRIGPEQKAKLTRLAERENKPVGELMRDLAEARLREEERRAWEAEARRQALAIAERAKDPKSDEARTMEWIEEVSRGVDWDA